MAAKMQLMDLPACVMALIHIGYNVTATLPTVHYEFNVGQLLKHVQSRAV